MMLMVPGVYTGYVVALAWISNSLPRPPAKRAAALAFVNAISNTSSIYASYMYEDSAGKSSRPCMCKPRSDIWHSAEVCCCDECQLCHGSKSSQILCHLPKQILTLKLIGNGYNLCRYPKIDSRQLEQETRPGLYSSFPSTYLFLKVYTDCISAQGIYVEGAINSGTTEAGKKGFRFRL
jgi:hypothetical protein